MQLTARGQYLQDGRWHTQVGVLGVDTTLNPEKHYNTFGWLLDCSRGEGQTFRFKGKARRVDGKALLSFEKRGLQNSIFYELENPKAEQGLFFEGRYEGTWSWQSPKERERLEAEGEHVTPTLHNEAYLILEMERVLG